MVTSKSIAIPLSIIVETASPIDSTETCDREPDDICVDDVFRDMS